MKNKKKQQHQNVTFVDDMIDNSLLPAIDKMLKDGPNMDQIWAVIGQLLDQDCGLLDRNDDSDIPPLTQGRQIYSICSGLLRRLDAEVALSHRRSSELRSQQWDISNFSQHGIFRQSLKELREARKTMLFTKLMLRFIVYQPQYELINAKTYSSFEVGHLSYLLYCYCCVIDDGVRQCLEDYCASEETDFQLSYDAALCSRAACFDYISRLHAALETVNRRINCYVDKMGSSSVESVSEKLVSNIIDFAVALCEKLKSQIKAGMIHYDQAETEFVTNNAETTNLAV